MTIKHSAHSNYTGSIPFINIIIKVTTSKHTTHRSYITSIPIINTRITCKGSIRESAHHVLNIRSIPTT